MSRHFLTTVSILWYPKCINIYVTSSASVDIGFKGKVVSVKIVSEIAFSSEPDVLKFDDRYRSLIFDIS